MKIEKKTFVLWWVLLGCYGLLCSYAMEAEPWEAMISRNVGHPTFMSPHSRPILHHQGRIYVVNTPADTLDVLDAQSLDVVDRINVGIDPVALALRPDGRELWVANHISDSVNVVDLEETSPTYHQVIGTVQELDALTKATRFDEPVGIAFAHNEKAYVALSSENEIAVVDVVSRRVIKKMSIPSQDPRAIAVRGDRLYVLPFESNNQTQISGGLGELDGKLKTFDARQHVLDNNNVLSVGAVVDIVKHPDIPDRDLYVFDTRTDEPVAVVKGLGTLLYGLTVDSSGTVYVAQTDARNAANGLSGTQGHGLAEMENRAFLNRITKVPFEADEPQPLEFMECEPLPPDHPSRERALATPFAIQVSEDDATLVISAASSDKLFTVDVSSGEILGRVAVESVPRGIALVSGEDGKPHSAWVLNAVANSVSLVALQSLRQPVVIKTAALEDPTPPQMKAGRRAFHDARASSTATFSCESCHPDGHTDQLLWVLKTPISTGGHQIVPRTTMPARGLRGTAPYHWDGIPGDPYGGINTASTRKSVAPNSDRNKPSSSTRQLVDGALATTMRAVEDRGKNDAGQLGELDQKQREDLSAFLLHIPYPPAQRRSYDNVLSPQAVNGFRLFHIDGDHQDEPDPNVCGDCHRMPYWVSTNTRGSGMDAPTWRGAYDRWMILPQGRLNLIDFSFYESIAERGFDERSIWRLSWGGRSRFDPIWDMVLEGSTGYSGSFARQLTLNAQSVRESHSLELLQALEQAATEGGIRLQAEGVFMDGASTEPIALEYDGGVYADRHQQGRYFLRHDLMLAAKKGTFVGTFTGRLGSQAGADESQPVIWSPGPIERQRGRQSFPSVSASKPQMVLSGRHVHQGARVYVNGRRVGASIELSRATHQGAAHRDQEVQVTLDAVPAVPRATQLVALGAPARSWIPKDDAIRRKWRGTPRYEPFDDSQWIQGRTGVGYDRDRGEGSYRALLGTDLGEAMEDHTSVYIRVSFEVVDPSRFDQLILRMQVDDGFVAYLNGERIASDRAPRRTSWDATADGASLDVDADRFDLFDITEHLSALRDGNNVLAIHGFNRSASSSDFLVCPELVGMESEDLGPGEGTHLLQIQNPDGLFSNDYIFFTAPVEGAPQRDLTLR